MADVKWIKIVTDVFDDEKTLMIETLPEADSIIVIWFKLLCLAGKQNNSGVFLMGRLPYTDEMFATVFRRPINTVRLALQTFEQFGMIEIVNNTVTIPNWDRHQSLDSFEKRKERDRLYQKERRAAQKAIAEKSSDSRPTIDDSSTDSSTDIASKIRRDKTRQDEIREEEKEIGVEPIVLTTPTLSDIICYINLNGFKVDADRFYSYYASRDWKDNKGKLIDWKAKLKQWHEQDKTKHNSTKSSNPFLDRLRDEE